MNPSPRGLFILALLGNNGIGKSRFDLCATGAAKERQCPGFKLAFHRDALLLDQQLF